MLPHRLRHSFTISLIGLLAFQWLPPARLARADTAGSTFVVDVVGDYPDQTLGNNVCAIAGGGCTLRAAIQEANTWPGDDLITFSAAIPTPATFNLTRAGLDDTALNGDLDITGNLTIQGRGAGLTIIDGNRAVTNDRVFQISSATVTLAGLSIRNGGGSADGAGIHSNGTLTVTNSALTSNIGSSSGGGIYSVGALWVINSAFTSNVAGGGGGIYNNNLVWVRNSTFTSNRATGVGGGLLNGDADQAEVTGSTFDGLHQANQGGAIYNDGWITLTGVKISGAVATLGGGLYNADFTATLNNSLLDGNTSFSEGGGIYNTALLNITNSTLSGNTAGGADGGGIYNYFTGGVYVTNSTLSGNSTSLSGGGIQNFGSLFMRNSTLSGNRADVSGGGLYNEGSANLYSVTLAGNYADDNHNGTGSGGGTSNSTGHAIGVINTLIANNLKGVATLSDCGGSLASSGGLYLASAGGCSFSGPWALVNSTTVGPLADNGGLVKTHALLTGSQAINAAESPSGCVDWNAAQLPSDQRGGARYVGAWCDVGAFEFGAKVPRAWLPLAVK